MKIKNTLLLIFILLTVKAIAQEEPGNQEQPESTAPIVLQSTHLAVDKFDEETGEFEDNEYKPNDSKIVINGFRDIKIYTEEKTYRYFFVREIEERIFLLLTESGDELELYIESQEDNIFLHFMWSDLRLVFATVPTT